jgi:serine/threonine-protein kinase
MPPGQPATIGRYTVQRVLGRGGMARSPATDPLIEREVAIGSCRSPAWTIPDRLIAEARVSGRLIHPNIVGVFDIGASTANPFCRMCRAAPWRRSS